MAKSKANIRDTFRSKKLDELGEQLQYRNWTLTLLAQEIADVAQRLSDGDIAVLDAETATAANGSPARTVPEVEDDYAAFYDDAE